MGMKICIDSNVFISVHNQEANHVECEKIFNAIEEKRHQGLLSTIVISEIAVGYYQIGEITELNLFISKCKANFEILPLSLEIAKEAAEIRAYNRIKLPDAIIIATARLHGADYLVSNDIPMTKKEYIPILTTKDISFKL
jgi:predicted nucleic acid-binding protein